MSSDITAQKQQELILANIFTNASEGLGLIDENGFIEVNPKLVSLFGFEHASELIGRRLDDASLSFDNIEPSRDSVTMIRANITKARYSGLPTRFNVDLTRSDAHWIAEVTLAPIEVEGRSAFVCMMRDVTEVTRYQEQLRRSQQQLKSLFTALPVGIMMVSRAGVILQGNRIARDILRIRADGTESLQERLQIWRAYNPDGSSMAVEHHPIFRALHKGETILNAEIGIRRPDEEIIWLSISLSPLSQTGMSPSHWKILPR